MGQSRIFSGSVRAIETPTFLAVIDPKQVVGRWNLIAANKKDPGRSRPRVLWEVGCGTPACSALPTLRTKSALADSSGDGNLFLGCARSLRELQLELGLDELSPRVVGTHPDLPQHVLFAVAPKDEFRCLSGVL